MLGSTIADYIYNLEQATAGAGVAFFRKYFPKPYYPYDSGTIKSVEGVSAHKTVGFNAFNPQNAIRGKRFGASGKAMGDRATGSISDYFRVVPNTVYYAKNVSGSGIGDTFVYYDSDKNWVGTYSISGNAQVSGTFTTTSDAYYMRFQYETADEDTVCINISWDGERNGEYEPYVEHSYPLDDSLTLRGIPKIANGKLYYDGDTYESDGTVTRKYGIVDLGTLNYTDNGAITGGRQFYTIINEKKIGTTNIRSSNFVAVALSETIGEMSGRDTNKIVAFNTTITSAASFKTAMSGVYLVYELATPTTETADTFVNPQIVDDFGTEEYITTSIVPVGHSTKYTNNLKAKLEMSPESPSGDGLYLVQQSSGQNAYVQYISPVPSNPSTDGTYVLKATVSGGTATLTWVAE